MILLLHLVTYQHPIDHLGRLNTFHCDQQEHLGMFTLYLMCCDAYVLLKTRHPQILTGPLRIRQIPRLPKATCLHNIENVRQTNKQTNYESGDLGNCKLFHHKYVITAWPRTVSAVWTLRAETGRLVLVSHLRALHFSPKWTFSAMRSELLTSFGC